MPNQMSNAAVRVVDPVLTTAVRKYSHEDTILTDALFPEVPVGKRAGVRIEFGKEDFRPVTTRRAPGSRVGRVQFGHAGANYSLEDHALGGIVPREHMQEAAGLPGSDLVARANESVMRIMDLNLERDQAALATNASNYDASNKVTLSGSDQWSDPTSDIIGQIEDWRAAVRADIGRDPNTLVLPYAARKAIRKHDQLSEAIKYTKGGFPSLDMLAEFFEIERIFIHKAMTSTDGDSLSDIWGDFAVMAFVAPPSTMGNPSYGYTYKLNGYPIAGAVRWDDDIKSWISDVENCRAAQMVGPDSGFLVTDVIG